METIYLQWNATFCSVVPGMSSENETIFCEILPELCRIYEQTRFSDSLHILIRHLRFGDEKKRPDDLVFQIQGIRCLAVLENCKAVRQKRMTETDEMMFGIFGQDSSFIKNSEIPSEILALNARLILPRASDQYVSHIEIRNYEIDLNPSYQDIFSCSPSEIKLCQKEKNEIYLHVNLKKEKQTTRSAIFEAIHLMLQELKIGKNFKRIRQLCIPFVHFGKVRISVKLDEKSGDLRVEIFNLFGSLFGFIDISENQEEVQQELFLSEAMLKSKFVSEDVESEDSVEDVTEVEKQMPLESTPEFLPLLISILQDKMNLLKPPPSGFLFTPLPYLGIDSLRLAELEYHIVNASEFKSCQLKSPFLLSYKTMAQIAQFLDEKNGEQVEEKSEIIPSNPVFKNETPLVSDQSEFEICLSSQQKRMLFIRELEKEQLKNSNIGSQFDEPVCLQFSIFPQKEITRILNQLIVFHTILRTQYSEDFQYLSSGTECFVAVTVRDVENTVSDFIPSIQCMIRSNGILQIIFNHISIDGRSLQIFYRQFKEMLNARNFKLPLATLQYHEYCRSRKFEVSEETLDYWKPYLNRELEQLPYDLLEPSEHLTASYLHVPFPNSIQKKFDTLCLQNSLSRFELFLGLLEVSLHRVFGISGSLALGFAVDQRSFEFFETIGCFTNVLLYLTRNPANENLMTRLKTCQKTLRESRSHGHIPYESLVKLSGIEGDLFQVFVVSDVVEIDPTSSEKSKRRVRFEDETVHVEIIQNMEDVGRKMAKYPMTWYLRQFSNDQLHVEVEYAKELFKEKTIVSLLEDLFRTVNGSEKQRRFKLEKPFLKSDFPSSTVSQIIVSNPQGANIRHLQKNSKFHSDALSSRLIKTHIQLYCQLLSECPVIINIPRSPDLIQAVLGCWNAGLYVVPMHRDATKEQIHKTSRGLGMEEVMILTNLDELNVDSRGRVFNRSVLYDIAYLTSTSGSTGTPKLVGTSFEGHSNLARQYTTAFQISSQDTIGQVVDPSFDIFFADIVKTFTNGARLLLARDSIATSSELLECTNVYLMPAFLSRIPNTECLRNLETLQYGGEPLAPQVLEQIFKVNGNLKVWQEFGLTEQTVYSARRRILPYRLQDPDEMRKIGDCFDNIRLDVRSFHGSNEECVRGQLILKGIGIMRGYYGVTKNQIQEFPTGDEVKKLENGDVVFIGRKDSQVKVRGHRIDLFEIECVALSTNLLESCTCVVIDSKELVLFFKLKSPGDEETSKLHTYLEKELVSYKVPDRLIHLEQFPLTRTGKIDKNQLHEMAKRLKFITKTEELEGTSSSEISSSKREGLACSLLKWLEYYSKCKINSTDDDIFSSGVDSISVMLTMQKLRSEKVEIPVKLFFKLKTIRKIVDWFYSTPANSKIPQGTLEASKSNEKSHDHFINLNHIQQRILFLSRMMPSTDPFCLQFSINLPSVSSDILTQTVNILFLGNKMLRAKLLRIQGEYRFNLLSGTEVFRIIGLENKNDVQPAPFETKVWLEQTEPKLVLSIHHLICDGRSLRILKEQLVDAFSLGVTSLQFENSFHIPPTSSAPRDLFSSLERWKPMYSRFQMGSRTSRLEFSITGISNSENVPATFRVAFAYCRGISEVFKLSSAFPIATTLANRTDNNWNTVSMFANTLPLLFDPEERFERFVENFYKLNENSNVPLTEVLPNGSTGTTFDFALNFHNSLRGSTYENLSQFPMLLTYSESENMAELEFDATFITMKQAESLKTAVLKELGCTPESKSVSIVEVFQKFLESEVFEETDFFHAGGHSLIAMKLIDHLSDLLEIEIPLRLIFEYRTPKKLEEAVKALRNFPPQVEHFSGSKTETQSIQATTTVTDVKEEKSDQMQFKFPLSRQQSQMFYLSQLTENSLEYQLPFIQPFPSSTAPSEIHRSLLMTTQEQDIFRTVFRMDSETGEPFQEVVSMTETFLRCQVEEVASEEELHERIRQLCADAIDVLSGLPLLRATFVSSPGKHVAFLHLHHLISDARSTQLTNSTMRSFFDNPKKFSRRLNFTYLDYCRLEHQEKAVLDNEYIQTLVSSVNEREHQAIETNKAGKCFIEIPKKAITERLADGDSPFSIFLKTVSSSLFPKAASFNIAFPVLNRNESTSNICGYFLNNLLINTAHLADLPTILNSNLPYSDVVREVRRVSGKDLPVAEVYINCRYDLEYDESDDEVLLDLVPLKLHFPIEIDVDLLANERYRVTMRSNRFDPNEIMEVLSRVKNQLEASHIENQKQNEDEFGKTLYGAKKDTPDYSIPNLYKNFFKASGTSIFATSLNQELSYRKTYYQLIQLSWKLSRDFLSVKGRPLRSDDIIAVVGSKSIETTIKCLAVQLSGAAYLPIDQGYPFERRKEILNDAVFALEGSSDTANPPEHHRHFSISTPHCLSYVITTSGTTGTPKSVAIEADSLSNLCLSSTISMRVSSSSRVFQFTNFVFDNSVLEVSMAIASQATLIYGFPNFDPVEFEKSIYTPGVTHCLLFPSLVQSFEIWRIRNLPYWIVGGERLPQSLLDSALNLGIQVIQNYGPTETTAFAIAKQMKKGDVGCQIGHPSVNSKVKIWRRKNDEGELLISGRGIMRGYLNRDPTGYFKLNNGESWYSSGDVCRILHGLEVEFIGRTDSQIKVRGYRVELSEIEAVIETNPDVKTCKVLFEVETQQIHAFYTGKADDIRKHCERLLEPQKIPSTFTFIEEFPLTGNSKIDKVKLLAIVKNPQTLSSLTCTLESEVSAIWISLLNCPKPSSSDHFFLTGGHSLLLIRLRHLIQTKLKVNLSVPEILENLKFGDMLAMLKKKKEALEDRGSNGKQNTIVFFPALYGGCTAYLKMATLLRSSSSKSLNIILLDEESGDNVDEVASSYATQILKNGTNISSSVILIGASSGGTFAFATSQKLQNDVTVILLDSGTFWNLIEKLDYSTHQQEMIENLKNYAVDWDTAQNMAKKSWKTLQVLKHYEPDKSSDNRRIHILSVDGSDLGWSKYSRNLRTHKINGDHYSMLQDSENVREVVKAVENIIANVLC